MSGLLLVSFLLVVGVTSRVVTFKNSCPFAIDVEGVPNGGAPWTACYSLPSGSSNCQWTIPGGTWSGNFHKRNLDNSPHGYPSATLAEFTFNSWNMDWFDISIIPPGCPGHIYSYDECWCNGGADGYDVGMVIQPLKCSEKTRTCLGRWCDQAYLFPKDDGNTIACTDTSGNFLVEFCPHGSFIDYAPTATDQTPPCKGGPGGGRGGTPPPPSPPPSSTSSCTTVANTDYYGSDIQSSKPVGSADECCNFCKTVPNCAVWTYANGVCYPKTSAALSNPKSVAGVTSGRVSVGCSTVHDVDYYGYDISNKPVGSTSECCDYCKATAGCGAWTLAYGVCYAKSSTALSFSRSSPGLISGKLSVASLLEESSAVSATVEPAKALFIGLFAAMPVIAVVIIAIIVYIKKRSAGKEEHV